MCPSVNRDQPANFRDEAAMTPTIAIMLKAPRIGEVKTRLARTVGAEEAARIYRRLVEHQLAEIPPEWKTHIHFSPPDAEEEMQGWLGSGRTCFPQSEGDLGARLESVMRAHFAATPEPLIFVGGDCPYLDSTLLRDVSAAMSRVDAALIPAQDGGYCLLALRRLVAPLFRAIAWSTGTVADETRARLREADVAWHELPALEDVDDEASWKRAQQALPSLASALQVSAPPQLEPAPAVQPKQ
jgi:rSAM/selenodomain-associated transferase 1